MIISKMLIMNYVKFGADWPMYIWDMAIWSPVGNDATPNIRELLRQHISYSIKFLWLLVKTKTIQMTKLWQRLNYTSVKRLKPNQDLLSKWTLCAQALMNTGILTWGSTVSIVPEKTTCSHTVLQEVCVWQHLSLMLSHCNTPWNTSNCTRSLLSISSIIRIV